MINHTYQGITVPALGFGTFSVPNVADAVRFALDIGYRHIDTAEMYDNEEGVGAGIAASSVRREDIFLTTKIWHTHLRPDDVRQSVQQSLDKLKTDYVDLLLIHWPNPDVPLGETLAALREVQEAGKTKLIGVSNFTVDLMREAVETHGAPVACNQVEYHPFLNQDRVIDYARSKDILVTAYCPIARGAAAKNDVLRTIGERYGKTPTQVCLRWLVQQDHVAAIPRSGSETNIRMNFDIFDFELSADDMALINGLRGDGRLVKPAHAPKWDPTPPAG
jgi:2,5-diketo-D-gluconate reductase B